MVGVDPDQHLGESVGRTSVREPKQWQRPLLQRLAAREATNEGGFCASDGKGDGSCDPVNKSGGLS